MTFYVTHELKVWPELFDDLLSGIKKFEYRRNDRDFYPGQKLLLKEYENLTEKFTGRSVEALILDIWGDGWKEIPDFPEGFCIMAIKILGYKMKGD